MPTNPWHPGTRPSSLYRWYLHALFVKKTTVQNLGYIWVSTSKTHHSFFAIFVVQRLLRWIKSKFSLQFESLESDLGVKNAFFLFQIIRMCDEINLKNANKSYHFTLSAKIHLKTNRKAKKHCKLVPLLISDLLIHLGRNLLAISSHLRLEMNPWFWIVL